MMEKTKGSADPAHDLNPAGGMAQEAERVKWVLQDTNSK
jgi:hypothetical protein